MEEFYGESEVYYAYIVEHLLGEDKDRRLDALNLISHLECDPRLADILLPLSRHADPEFRRIGLEALGLWRHSDGVAQLMEMIGRDLTAEEEELAILSMGSIGGQDALHFLMEYADRRFSCAVGVSDSRGMAAVEGIVHIAREGHATAGEFLLRSCAHPNWNFREACADGLGVIYGGRESIPRVVYDTLVKLSQDENKDVRIAAYMSLDAIVGLDAVNKQKLEDARRKQVFG